MFRAVYAMLYAPAKDKIFGALIEAEYIGFGNLASLFLFTCRPSEGTLGISCTSMGGILDLDVLLPVLLPISELRDSKAAPGTLHEVTRNCTGSANSNFGAHNVRWSLASSSLALEGSM